MPKEKSQSVSSNAKRKKHNPLEMDILSQTQVTTKEKSSNNTNAKKKSESTTTTTTHSDLESKISKKILSTAKAQTDELDKEKVTAGFQIENAEDVLNNLDNLDQLDDLDDFKDDEDLESIGEHGIEANEELTEEEQEHLNHFIKPTLPSGVKFDLGNIILQKIQEKEKEMGKTKSSATQEDVEEKLHPKVVQAYKQIGAILKTYRSGSLPKAFKAIPSLSNWEEILLLTKPDDWSPHAVYQATRLFASGLKEKMAQRFYNLILLPHVRNDIIEHKKLNPHLFKALEKACFKPPAFFKGIVIPLCESGDCTYREADIIGGVIKRKSLPVLHSAAALMKIASMEYSGAISLFIRHILEKRYALPAAAVDALLNHFMQFLKDDRPLNVIWHKSLLVFVQLYKSYLSREQKVAILKLCRKHSYKHITPVIRTELASSVSVSTSGNKKNSNNEKGDQMVDEDL